MHLYDIPVIQPDLRHEETILQTADALKQLSNIVNEVFDRIDARVSRNLSKTAELNERIRVANDKVDKVVGINKAIKIFSPAKYPAVSTLNDIPMTFCPTKCSKIAINTDYVVKSGLEPVGHRDITEKVECYSVRPIQRHYGTVTDGHGVLPSNIESIDQTLLFNAAQLVYGDNVGTRSGGEHDSGQRTTRPMAEINVNKLDAAPLSISNRRVGNKKMHEGLSYVPGMAEAPEIDVPDDLPDLPGIADDIAFDTSGIDELPIVPSMMNNLNLPDLPAVLDVVEDIIADPAGLNEITAPQPMARRLSVANLEQRPIDATDNNNVMASPPPPPPPPPPVLAPPPPPPPPPPSLPDIHIEPQSSSEAKRPAPKIEPQENMHSNLMAAIRQAGGLGKAKLRAGKITDKTAVQRATPKAAPGGDLMADLHNKLALRRKGISGIKDATNDNPPNVMDRISAMIPPPPKPGTDTSDNDDDDDEWE